jgi:hypothetical protein
VAAKTSGEIEQEFLDNLKNLTGSFYTDLGRGNGVAGVNINSGSTERSIRMSAPDDRFLSDEEANLFYVSQDTRLLAYALNDND